MLPLSSTIKFRMNRDDKTFLNGVCDFFEMSSSIKNDIACLDLYAPINLNFLKKTFSLGTPLIHAFHSFAAKISKAPFVFQ